MSLIKEKKKDPDKEIELIICLRSGNETKCGKCLLRLKIRPAIISEKLNSSLEAAIKPHDTFS